MTNVAWPLAEFAARLLEHPEREAVLGDLAESGETTWGGVFEVLGLALRYGADYIGASQLHDYVPLVVPQIGSERRVMLT